MENVREKIERNLSSLPGFRREDIYLEDVRVDNVAGFVVSDIFENMDDMERQNYLWDHLRAFLSDEERLKIVAIITVTREEYEAYSEESVAV